MRIIVLIVFLLQLSCGELKDRERWVIVNAGILETGLQAEKECLNKNCTGTTVIISSDSVILSCQSISRNGIHGQKVELQHWDKKRLLNNYLNGQRIISFVDSTVNDFQKYSIRCHTIEANADTLDLLIYEKNKGIIIYGSTILLIQKVY